MRNKLFLLFVLLIPLQINAQSKFKNMVWYEQWCEMPYKTSGYGLPPWYIDWTGIDVIVHFDNNNVNYDAPPYWAYIARGNAFADSAHFFWGQYHDYNYVDSLTIIGHRYGAIVVVTIQAQNPTILYWIIQDSARCDTFCNAVARWCETYNYDGVDVNIETRSWVSSDGDVFNTSPASPLTRVVYRTEVARFIRRLRYFSDLFITSHSSTITRPWISFTSPWSYLGSLYFPSDTAYIDMFCPQQGTLEVVWGGASWGNPGYFINWYGGAIKLGRSDYTYPQSMGFEIATFQEDASWIPANRKPMGVRSAVSKGFPKSMLAPAFSIGGAAIYRGSDTLFGNATYRSGGYTRPFNNRCQLNALKLNGGIYHWDADHEAEYIAGTATTSLWSGFLTAGEKFWAPLTDSISVYHIANWLIDNGYGGIAPYSCSYDADSSAPATLNALHLKGHYGIYKAKDEHGLIHGFNRNPIIPSTHKLGQNYPNPFNPVTMIPFYLSQPGFITLKLYDVLGRFIATLVEKQMDAGTHTVELAGSIVSKISSGIYFYQLETNNGKEAKKMILLK